MLVAAGTWWVYGSRLYLGVLSEEVSLIRPEEIVVDQHIEDEKKGGDSSLGI